ncbi:hypothetical protein HYC85_010755 [Camellia sinensis]|uniref:Uncharacterized protein n=1 Tax=Camellia sinensis TaxID=4442 RepID=A0A7J7HKP5_CAMSI|nr:hypothetical protein HYC85_010755 [Camellia sinensis]
MTVERCVLCARCCFRTKLQKHEAAQPLVVVVGILQPNPTPQSLSSQWSVIPLPFFFD